MCLGEIARVVEVGPERTALVRSPQRDSRVSLLTLDGPVAMGEWLVCHSGFALGRVSAEEARAASSIRATTGTVAGSAPTTSPGVTSTAATAAAATRTAATATAPTSATEAGPAAPPVMTRKDPP